MPRIKNDFYQTPQELADMAVTYLKANKVNRVLDPSCGTGVWGQAVRLRYGLSPRITGIDIERTPDRGNYTKAVVQDFLTWSPGPGNPGYDLVVCNPPYDKIPGLNTPEVKQVLKNQGLPVNRRLILAEAFIRKSVDLLNPGGEALFLVRSAFLGSQFRGEGLWKDYPPVGLYFVSRRPSFTPDTKSSEKGMEYVVIRFKKDVTGKVCKLPQEFDWFMW